MSTVVHDSSLVSEKALKAAGVFGVLAAGTVIRVVVGGEADGLTMDITTCSDAGEGRPLPGTLGRGTEETVLVGVVMEVIIVRKPEDAAPIVADAYSALIAAKPDAVLGLATGSTPLGVYRELIRRHHEEGLSFAQVTAFNLDEYVGLPAGHPQLYRTFIEREFTGQVDFAPDAVHGPDGLAEDLAQAGRDYDQAINDAGGIDIQILGIGSDGHLAFNMPGSSLVSRTRLKTLTSKTREDNARFFDGDINQVPKHCLTQGLGTIMNCRHAILLGFGKGKAQAVAECVEGGVSARWPASILQMHPHATVVIDEDAASQLRLTGYYTNTYEGKPDWQGI